MIEKIKKAVVGDPASQTIEAGTLVTTRGIGVIIVGLIGGLLLLESFDYGPWTNLATWQQFTFVVASGFIWSIVAAADGIARGLAADAEVRIVALPPGLRCTHLVGEDEPGWTVAAARIGPSSDNSLEFLIVKGTTHQWAKTGELRFNAN